MQFLSRVSLKPRIKPCSRLAEMKSCRKAQHAGLWGKLLTHRAPPLQHQTCKQLIGKLFTSTLRLRATPMRVTANTKTDVWVGSFTHGNNLNVKMHASIFQTSSSFTLIRISWVSAESAQATWKWKDRRKVLCSERVDSMEFPPNVYLANISGKSVLCTSITRCHIPQWKHTWLWESSRLKQSTAGSDPGSCHKQTALEFFWNWAVQLFWSALFVWKQPHQKGQKGLKHLSTLLIFLLSSFNVQTQWLPRSPPLHGGRGFESTSRFSRTAQTRAWISLTDKDK